MSVAFGALVPGLRLRSPQPAARSPQTNQESACGTGWLRHVWSQSGHVALGAHFKVAAIFTAQPLHASFGGGACRFHPAVVGGFGFFRDVFGRRIFQTFQQAQRLCHIGFAAKLAGQGACVAVFCPSAFGFWQTGVIAQGDREGAGIVGGFGCKHRYV